MFWRADSALKALSRDRRWTDFHRACGRCGLFFDDIDPINDKPLKDVTDQMRGRGYSAVAFRASQDRGGFYIQVLVARGTGADPVAAVRDAYRRAIEAGDPVQHGLDAIFDGAEYPQPAVATEEIDILGLIG
jgi:hypothetical protein